MPHHHTTHRRILAQSDHTKTHHSKPSTTTSLHPNKHPEPTKHTNRKHHPKPTTSTYVHPTTTHPEPTKLFLSLNADQKVRTAPKEPNLDTRLQAKAMSLSAMVDSSKPIPDSQDQKKLRQGVRKLKLFSSKEASKDHKDTKKGDDNNGQDLKKSNQEHEEIKRLSSGAIVKIKEFHEEQDNRRPSIYFSKRRSFCGSHVDLADFFNGAGARVVAVDMPPFMQIHAVDCARKASDSLEKFTSKALAFNLKKEFDGVYGPAWHCIVGTSFGSFVTHSVGGFLYFSLDHKLYVLLFKTTVQRAD